VAEIAESIAADRPWAAGKWLEDVFAAVQRLASFPTSGRIVPERRHEDIREVIHGKFRIIYHIDAVQVTVLTVRHSRQLTTPEDMTE
jgi:plasmid stabilization system protein ParE